MLIPVWYQCHHGWDDCIELAAIPARWAFRELTRLKSAKAHDSGFLELLVLLLRSAPERQSQSHNCLAIESTWMGTKFSITWAARQSPDSNLGEQATISSGSLVNSS